MKISLTILLIAYVSFSAFGQTDSISVNFGDSLLNGVQLKKLDSLKYSISATSDRLRQSYVREKEKLSALKLRYQGNIDSLKQKPNLLDSLTPNTDVNFYTQKIDSLDRQLESVQHKTTARIDSLKRAVNNQLNKLKLPKEARTKVAEITSSMDKVNVPSFDAGIYNMPDFKDVGADLTAIRGTLPGADLPDANLPALNTDLRGTNLNTPDLKNNLPTELNTDKFNQLNDVVGQAGDVQKQISEATSSTEGLGKTLESKAGEHVKGLPDQKLPGVPGLEGGVPKTNEEAKQQLLDAAKKEAVNHFAGKEAVLTTAMEKMSKYKQKYSSVSSLKDIQNKKHYNDLKGKPLCERLVPAVTFQFQSWKDFMLDVNPSVGYKFTSHFTAGMGWSQRVAFNIPQRQFNNEAKVYGIRAYGEYTLKKGFGFIPPQRHPPRGR